MIKVLFVCMGNICRSPTAQGVFRGLVERRGLQHHISTDSAGTIAFHVGNPPDRRAMATAKTRGFDLSDMRARQVSASDFSRFDYVLAMDESNHQDLQRICPDGMEHKLHMFLDFAPQLDEREVPDPYYGGQHGFEHVFDLVEAASAGLIRHIEVQDLVKSD